MQPASQPKDPVFGDFFRNKKVLVTGHTGFKGSWLSAWLLYLGADVSGLSLAPEDELNLFDAAGLATRMRSSLGDIRDLATCQKVMTETQPEVVIHMAAQALVRRSYREPVETFATNVMGTVNVLEAIRQCPSVNAAVMVTTDKVYENREWEWGYREVDALGGHDPYSASKGASEIAIAAYRRSFFQTQDGAVQIGSARAGNVIGGGDWSQDRLIPDIVRGALADETIHIRSPHATRPWQHVLEPLRGYLTLAKHMVEQPRGYDIAFNFGPDEGACNVEFLARQFVGILGSGKLTVAEQVDGPHEAGYLSLDTARAKARLGWHPWLDLQASLEFTANWYRDHKAGGSAHELMSAQIQDYAGRAR